MSKTNKTILELYIREVVKNAVRSEVQSVINEMITEGKLSVGSSSNLAEQTSAPANSKAPSREEIKAIMSKHFHLEGDTLAPTAATIVAPSTGNASIVPPHTQVDDAVMAAINRDYSSLVKKL